MGDGRIDGLVVERKASHGGMLGFTRVQPLPPGVAVDRNDEAIELRLDRPHRRRRSVLSAGVFGVAFGVGMVGAGLDSAAPKELLFVLSTVFAALAVAGIRSALLGRRPTRIVLDVRGLRVENARPWSSENVRLDREAIERVEQTATGIGVKTRDAVLVPVVRDLSAEQAVFLEALLQRELDHEAADQRT